jgi:hypothetical protein
MSDMNDSRYENIYNYSHLISSTIGVFCLKKYNPILLLVLLLAQLGYITSVEAENMGFPRSLLFICGVVLYVISEYIMSENKLEINYQTLWKIPYFGIITYYIFYSSFTLTK